jgi:serine protease Do
MEQEQIRELLSGIILDLDNYKQIYNALAQYVAEMNRSMVTVTGVSSGVDWFNNVNESKNQSSGVIIAQNGKQLLILTDYSPVKQADDIIVTFNEGTQADASLKEKDETTGLAVIAVELDTLNEDFLKNDITIATLGSSNIKDIAGLPVVALGRPMGTNDSLGYGIITSSASESAASDTTYRILQTNIVGSQNAGGVLFNLLGGCGVGGAQRFQRVLHGLGGVLPHLHQCGLKRLQIAVVLFANAHCFVPPCINRTGRRCSPRCACPGVC